MKRWTIALTGVIALALLTDVATAQRPGGGPRGPGQRPGVRRGPNARGPGRDFHPPAHPLMIALDTDKDGELSATEIENAAAALKSLDADGDGKLGREELRPKFPGRGGPGGADRPGRGGGADRPGRPGGPGGADRPGRGGLAERLMSFDKNKDGKVDKDELPEQMQRILRRADTNGDGAINTEEAQKLGEQFPRGPGGARPGPGGGNRPRRPRF